MAHGWTWVIESVALAAHAEQIAEHGGGEGVRDAGLLGSAMARPRNLAEYGDPDVAALAAAMHGGSPATIPSLTATNGRRRSCPKPSSR